MNTALTLKRGISAEIYKFRGTFTLWFLILAPAFVPTINFIIFISKGEQIMANGGNAWQRLLSMSLDPANFLFAFFVIIVALFVHNIEYTSNTWKLIYTQPLNRTTIYLSKLLVFFGMLFFSLILFGLFTVVCGYAIHFFKPDLGFAEAFDKSFIFLVCIKLFLATLGFASIHFMIGQIQKNLILPLGIGIAGIISFLILVQGWEYAIYHPYGYHMLSLQNWKAEGFSLWANMQPVYLSLGLAAATLIGCGIYNTQKRIF